MTDREKQKHKDNLVKVGKGIDKGATVIKTILSIIGLVVGGLVIYGFVSAGKAVYDVFAGFFGG